MKYHQMGNNFIPKEQKVIASSDIKLLEERNQILQDENHKLLEVIEEYKQQIHDVTQEYKGQIGDIEEQLLHKEGLVIESEKTIVSLENDMKKYRDLEKDLHHIDGLKIKINGLNSEIDTLAKENITLKEELASYQQQVQILYIILLILAIL